MACSGGHCGYHCYNNVCDHIVPYSVVGTVVDTEGVCTHNVSYPYTELTGGQQVNAGLITQNEHINDLRGAIDQERVRRGYPQIWNGTTIPTTNLIDNSDLISLKSAINEMKPSVFDTYTEGSRSLARYTDRLRFAIEGMRQECLCNGNCGSNLVCMCYNDCGCFYSDRRLKTNIRIL